LKLAIKYYGTIREAARKREETIEAREGVTLEQLFAILSQKYGAEYTKLLRSSYLRVFVNERLFDEKDREQRIDEGSTISFVLALHGG